MRSAFFEFSVATSALFTARGNMDVTSHNISNASVKGYSRQYAEQRASTPLRNDGRGMVGTGSEIYGIGQYRDFYLDKKYWTERGVAGEYNAKLTQLNIIESLMNEIPDKGMSNAFNDFFKKLQDLTQKSEDLTHRSNVTQSASTLTNLIRSKAFSMQKQQGEINEEIATVVNEIDSLGKRIATLNQQIYKFEIDGAKCNDLRDERARLVDQLSRLVNVDAYEIENNDDYAAGKYPEPEDRGKSDKHFIVMINGYELVNHFHSNGIGVVPRNDQPYNASTNRDGQINEFDTPGLYNIRFSSGVDFDLRHPSLKGELKGLIDVRDGNAIVGSTPPITDYKGIPYFIEKLNNLVRTFALAVNEGLDRNGNAITNSAGGNIIGHTGGYDLEGRQGNLFFSFDKTISNTADDINYSATRGYYNKFNVFNFDVASELQKHPELLAAAQEKLSGESDNRVILGFANIKTHTKLFAEGKIEDYIVGTIGELAIEANQASRFTENYTDVITLIDNQRMSVSGVDLNEEMVSMMRNMQLYQAASKLINTIDSIYDNLINRLGAF